MDGILPSFATDYAHNAGESKYPALWNGLVYLAAPFLGATGGKLRDFSKNNTTVSLIADTHFVPGKYGLAINFDGTGDQCNFDTQDKLEVATGDHTIVFGIKIVSLAALQGICSIENALRDNSWAVHIRDDTLIYIRGDEVNADQMAMSPAPPAGEWIQCVATVKGTTLQWYLNGTTRGSDTLTLTPFDSADLRHFGALDNNNGPFTGDIGHFGVYNRALSPAEAIFLTTHPTALLELADMVIGKTPVAPPAGNAGIMTTNTGFWGPTF